MTFRFETKIEYGIILEILKNILFGTYINNIRQKM